jgi:glutamate synthase domain-containing protein 3
MLFDALGFESDTLLGSFFLEISKEFIENVVIRNPQNISKYFGSNGCEYMASDFVVVLGEAGADIMVKSVINHIKKEALIAANSGEGGISSEIYGLLSGSLLGALSDSILVKGLSKVVKEAFQNEMLEKLKPYVKNAICNMELPDLSDIFSDFTGYFGFGEDENETVVA